MDELCGWTVSAPMECTAQIKAACCTYLLDWICDGWPVVPAQAAEDHGAEGGPDREPATRPHQRQRRAVRGPPVQTVKRRITRFLTPLHLAKNIYLLSPF